MTRNVLRSLMLVMFTALVTMTWVVDAAATTSIAACGQSLSKRGETYVLTGDLTSSGGDCLIVGADSITIDLKGHSISGFDGTGAGIREGDAGWLATTVRSSTTKPGTIQGFQYGIDLASSTRSQILNITSKGNTTNGMILGNRALVKGCTASSNAWYGIEALDYAQVQDSVASANGAGGILVGNSSLLVRNRADNNVNSEFSDSYVSGIIAGSRATLTGNYVGDNAGSGLEVGPQSQVNSNYSENNLGIGMRVSCPSTVANNQSYLNGGSDYEMYPETCRTTNNKHD